MLDFTKQELSKIQVHTSGVDPDNFDHKGLPTDIHLVKYQLNNGIIYDAVRGYTKVDIFDAYHDRLKPQKGEVLDIRSGYGNVRPNLYGKIKTNDEG